MFAALFGCGVRIKSPFLPWSLSSIVSSWSFQLDFDGYRPFLIVLVNSWGTRDRLFAILKLFLGLGCSFYPLNSESLFGIICWPYGSLIMLNLHIIALRVVFIDARFLLSQVYSLDWLDLSWGFLDNLVLVILLFCVRDFERPEVEEKLCCSKIRGFPWFLDIYLIISSLNCWQLLSPSFSRSIFEDRSGPLVPLALSFLTLYGPVQGYSSLSCIFTLLEAGFLILLAASSPVRYGPYHLNSGAFQLGGWSPRLIFWALLTVGGLSQV